MLLRQAFCQLPIMSNQLGFSSKKLFSTICNKNIQLLQIQAPNNVNILRAASTANNMTEATEPNRTRVYYGILTPQIRAVKLFSLTTSVGGLIAQPILFQKAATMNSIPIIVAVCSFVGFFTFVTPFLLHLITKKYVVYVDYNTETDKYIAGHLNIFNKMKELEFTPDDVKVPDVSGMFTTFTAKGVPLFVDVRLFEDVQHYSKIMGYDKPLDFKLYDTSLAEEAEKSKNNKKA